jgi:hypothetical protein
LPVDSGRLCADLGHDVALVIVTALRVEYLSRLLASLAAQTHVPVCVAQTRRFLFVHRMEQSADTAAFAHAQALATAHRLDLVEFWSAHRPTRTAAETNRVWHRMMHHAFTELALPEAFVVEEDVELSPDALLVTAALLWYKATNALAQRFAVQTALGGWCGENKINARPDTLVVHVGRNFQPIAYTLNASDYARLRAHVLRLRSQPDIPRVNDWCEEIGLALHGRVTLLAPTVGRMYHIGAAGLGAAGVSDTKARRNIFAVPPWNPWAGDLIGGNGSKPLSVHGGGHDVGAGDVRHVFVLDPPDAVTDVFGFVCTPPVVGAAVGAAALRAEQDHGHHHGDANDPRPPWSCGCEGKFSASQRLGGAKTAFPKVCKK